MTIIGTKLKDRLEQLGSNPKGRRHRKGGVAGKLKKGRGFFSADTWTNQGLTKR